MSSNGTGARAPSEPGVTTTPGTARRSFRVAAVFYALILFEFLYMASPFAAYFYAAYGPGLNVVGDNPVLAVLARSFLPHIAEQTRNPILDLHNVIGAGLAALGLLGFCAGAVQVYHHRLFRRGVVLGGVYRVVRHPQYTCLAIAGVGMLLLWPRYLVLLSFVTMLFAYYFLARLEERECLARFGEPYRDYLRRTRMFLPFRLPIPAKWTRAGRVGVGRVGVGRVAAGRRWIAGTRARRVAAVAVGYLLAVSVATAGAMLTERLAVGSLYARYTPSEAYVSVTRIGTGDLERLADLVAGRPEVRAARAGAGTGARFITYVLPADWYVSETLMAPRPGGGHLVPTRPAGHRYRVVITRARLRRPAEGRAILANTTSRRPVLEVVVDLAEGRVLGVEPPYTAHQYSGIPVPLY